MRYHAFAVNRINPPEPTKYGCLAVRPLSDITSTAEYLGEADPASVIYVLSNTGGASLNWTAAVGTPGEWLSVSASSGTLEPGESVEVTVEIDSTALAPYTYSMDVNFVNATNACGNTTITVNLTVTGEIVVDFEYRLKGGTATLIGHSEFAAAGASSPPKKYRKKTANGTLEDCVSTSPGCGGSKSSAKYDYLGNATYDVSTGALTNTLTLDSYNTAGVCPATDLISSVAQAPTWGDATVASSTCLMTVTVTKTLITRARSNVCCDDVPVAGQSTFGSGTMTWALTEEDTEADAITRVTAGAWGAWAAIVTQGDGKSQYEHRTAGFSFTYFAAEWRVHATALLPSTTYYGSANIYKRAYGTLDPWVLDSTVNFSATSDGAGTLDYSQALPNASGYEYCAFEGTLA